MTKTNIKVNELDIIGKQNKKIHILLSQMCAVPQSVGKRRSFICLIRYQLRSVRLYRSILSYTLLDPPVIHLRNIPG